MPPRITRRSFVAASACAAILRGQPNPEIQFMKTPQGGLQPQAVVDEDGVIHLVYLLGDPAAADIGYVRKAPGNAAFGEPVRVNSQPGSAVALGTVRGVHLAIGRAGRVHVAWNGSTNAEPKGPNGSAPMLYSRLDPHRNAFESQRSVMTRAGGLDGGGALAADKQGNVYVTWHGQGQINGKSVEGEAHRRVWLARSTDDGFKFRPEVPVSPAELGACGCCGMGALTDEAGTLYLLYRTAREVVHRDMYLLSSRDGGRSFQTVDLQPWEIGACPMSTVSLVRNHGCVLLSWETAKQVYFAAVDSHTGHVGSIIAAPGNGPNRKHPAIATAKDGRTLLVWTEGTGWKRGGELAWQLFNDAGRPLPARGVSPGLPAWDFATAVPVNRGFLVVS